MKRMLALASLSWMLCSATLGQDVVKISSCANQPALPLPFEVDCSHVTDSATRRLCRPFAENQACKVFWAYRKITDIKLEDSCHTFKYTIYDQDKWPYGSGEGGLAAICGANYITDYSLLFKSNIGPYDVHEILHVYQDSLGAIPDPHILFPPAMAEAEREIGDNKAYADDIKAMKDGLQLKDGLLKERQSNIDYECVIAEKYTEANLYLQDPNNLFLFYRKLERDWDKDMAARLRRFNRMFDLVSGGTARRFLLSHCPLASKW